MPAPTRKLSNAKKSIGMYLEMDNGDSPLTFAAIGDITNVKPTGSKFDEIDTTHLLSPADEQGNIWKEFQFGVVDGGTVDLTMNFTMQDNQDKLIAAQGTRKQFNICFPQLTNTSNTSGTKISFSAMVNTVVPSPELKGVITATCQLRVTGAMTYAALS